LWSPRKKLMNIRKNRTTDFSFEWLEIPDTSPKINISFNKNIFTIQIEWREKPIQWKNLGKLLQKREDGIRIFDWKELKIISSIYQKLVVNFRKNAKIRNTNFAVRDSIKNRVYIIDSAGEVNFIDLQNTRNTDPLKKGKNYGILKTIPSTGRLLLNKKQQKEEFYQNPLLMWQLMKIMNKKLRSF
jgi:hypothetical protein